MQQVKRQYTKTLQSHTSWIYRRFYFVLFIGSLLLAAVLSIGISVSLGQVDIPFSLSYRILLYQITGIQIGDLQELTAGPFVDIVWKIRFPRVLMALIVGAGLSLCGTIMQATVQNPLADPYILGISSGGSLGATFAILIGVGSMSFLGQSGVAFWAFTGALAASLLVLILSGIGGKMTSVKLVLSGMVINALCTSFSNFIVYLANHSEGIKTVTFWTMGSLAASTWDKLPLLTIVVGLTTIFFLFQSRILNTMLMGDEAAVTLGVQLVKYRRSYLIISALVTGVIVAGCGVIGFVGLIIPHVIRGLVGSDHRRLIPAAVLFGANFLIWADVIARIVVPNVELPIGIITSLIGAPLFMYMLIKKGYSFGGK